MSAGPATPLMVGNKEHRFVSFVISHRGVVVLESDGFQRPWSCASFYCGQTYQVVSRFAHLKGGDIATVLCFCEHFLTVLHCLGLQKGIDIIIFKALEALVQKSLGPLGSCV